jgi:hypothetical protein
VPSVCWCPCTTPSSPLRVSVARSWHSSSSPSPVSQRGIARWIIQLIRSSRDHGFLLDRLRHQLCAASCRVDHFSNRSDIGGTTYPGQSNAAWRLPLGIQLVPGALLCIGSIFLPFSPRWLMLRGEYHHALLSLTMQVARRSAWKTSPNSATRRPSPPRFNTSSAPSRPSASSSARRPRSDTASTTSTSASPCSSTSVSSPPSRYFTVSCSVPRPKAFSSGLGECSTTFCSCVC